MRRITVTLSALAATALLTTALLAGPAAAATPPAQPKEGPGGFDNPNAEIVRRGLGRVSAATYAYYMAGKPAEPRPVVVFLHAWGATNPKLYGGWIDHLARAGYLVLFPAFQEVGRTRPVDASTVAADLLKEAFATLSTDEAVRPDPARVAYIGHSAGAGIAANLAATAKASGLPVPRLVFAIMPGGIASDAKSRGIQLVDLATVEPATALVTLIGDREFQASDRTARRLLREASAVPVGSKLFMRAASDDHGFPSLSATLASPASSKEAYDPASIKLAPDPPVDPKLRRVAARPRWSADMVLTGEQTVLVGQLGTNTIDTLDYLAFWRTFDMLAPAAFGTGGLAPVKSDPSFVDMGRWSDGWPVRRLSAETPRPVEAAATPAAVRPAAANAKLPVTRPQRQPRRRD